MRCIAGFSKALAQVFADFSDSPVNLAQLPVAGCLT